MPASRTDSSPADHGRIEDIDVAVEMQGSFLEYAYSVIYSRALPDARDGLKPVQRRILFQMADMGLRPDRGHVKSARVVGEVMGKLHPHGDAPIYDALVRLAQPFSLRVPLVDGHGNFGSLDDGPAAPRYTEARLAPAALALTENLDEDVVDFIPNYDGQFQQPAVLPGGVPEPARQRRDRDRGRHGDEHGAAQPHRGRRGGDAPAREPRGDARRAHGVRARPGPSLGRRHRRPRRDQGCLRDRSRHLPHAREGLDRAARSAPHRAHRHGAAVPRRPRAHHREDQGCGPVQEAAGHRGRHRSDRPPPRPAPRDRDQDGLRPAGGARSPLPADAARGLVRHQQRRPRRRGSRRRSVCASFCGCTSTTASRS